MAAAYLVLGRQCGTCCQICGDGQQTCLPHLCVRQARHTHTSLLTRTYTDIALWHVHAVNVHLQAHHLASGACHALNWLQHAAVLQVALAAAVAWPTSSHPHTLSGCWQCCCCRCVASGSRRTHPASPACYQPPPQWPATEAHHQKPCQDVPSGATCAGCWCQRQ